MNSHPATKTRFLTPSTRSRIEGMAFTVREGDADTRVLLALYLILRFLIPTLALGWALFAFHVSTVVDSTVLVAMFQGFAALTALVGAGYALALLGQLGLVAYTAATRR